MFVYIRTAGESLVEDSDLRNIGGESAFDNGNEDQPLETGLANAAENMSEVQRIPFEKGDSSAETNIVEDDAADIQVHDEPQKTELASANVQSCYMNAGFENVNILADKQIVITITEVESQDGVEDNVEDNIFADEDVSIEENVGETTFEKSASDANSSGRDNNEIEIAKELGQASPAEERESKEDASEVSSNEEDDFLGEDDGVSESETELGGKFW